ncbi:glycosyltransferase [Mesobacillus subterraneus]|uniref:glycosyltransferase n=1 Tax=Mesobacillus subterraneus TaxID=285983 RepID=UPI00203E5C59|nr:glycosyltransferase [Mesobacillus subterraneus]MCM3574703.1 glycosyltransferase [Mesobacillus subterraneus]
MKKSVLFVIDSLECAGAEKSLVTLLSLLDYSSYEVDLMLFGHGGALEGLVPKEVNILKPLPYTEFSSLNFKDAILYSAKNLTYQMLTSRIKYTLNLRVKNYKNSQKARLYWQSVSKVIEKNPKNYDIAISYAQGVPTFYVAEKVTAAKKFAWVNVSYRLDENERQFQKKYYDRFNKIVNVSESTEQVFLETFPCYKGKTEVIYDINNAKLIDEMSKIGPGYDDGFDGLRILTIGRLANQKGYDLAIDACKLLKNKGVNFRWYSLGKGPLENEIKEMISKNGLNEHFILLGVKSNPYPYIKNTDIYVQTSRFEGFGLAIAEARMLNIPVVTTHFDAVFNQMIQEKNGLVVEMNPESVSNGILRLINDPSLRETIIQFLSHEKKGNVEEIERFYQLIS